MLDTIGAHITTIADAVCGYPLFIALICGGVWLFLYSGAVSLRRLPAALKELKHSHSISSRKGEISSIQALASVVAATIGMGNIAGVTIAIAMGGPGAVFWMWVSAIVGMCTKYHEGVLAIMYRGKNRNGEPQGGTMHIIHHGLSPKWHPMAAFFALAGMFGTLCIMNSNQLAEAAATTAIGIGIADDMFTVKFIAGVLMALIVGMVVLGGIKRIANVASVMVPFMVGCYFLMVLYIIITHFDQVGGVFHSIFTQAFNIEAGWGALAGVAMIGARRAALVNDAGIGTASIMHGKSVNNEPVREGLVAMLGPAIDSGFVCTLTAVAVLLCVPEGMLGGSDIKGLEVALAAFGNGIPGGEFMLMAIVACFALSSMFSYSFYGQRCAAYLMGETAAKYYTYIFIATLILFAIVPLRAAVGLCDLFYALMAFPTMLTLILLAPKVKEATQSYFSLRKPSNDAAQTSASLS